MMMGSQSRWLSGAVLIAAGLYQLSPLKNVCLSHCRAPASFLSRHWRPHALGALRLGAMHGAYCVGCCWMLMALLFVGGVMNLVWIAALAVLVLVEKVMPPGPVDRPLRRRRSHRMGHRYTPGLKPDDLTRGGCSVDCAIFTHSGHSVDVG